MPHEKRELALLLDMLDSANAAVATVHGLDYAQYIKNRTVRRAVEREWEIIGEAARKIPQSFQDANGQLPWRRITATRHRLAHEYGEIDDQIIWKIVTVHIPELVDTLKSLIQAISELNTSDGEP